MQQLDLFNDTNDIIAVIRPKRQQPPTKIVTPVYEEQPEDKPEVAEPADEKQSVTNKEVVSAENENQFENKEETVETISKEQYENKTTVIQLASERQWPTIIELIVPANENKTTVAEPFDEKQPEPITQTDEPVSETQSELAAVETTSETQSAATRENVEFINDEQHEAALTTAEPDSEEPPEAIIETVEAEEEEAFKNDAEDNFPPADEKQPEQKFVQLIKPLSKNVEQPSRRGRKSLKEINLDVALLDIPEDEILFQKQYYSISEVAEWFNMKPSLLRFWENEFDILKPRKNKKGDRLFRPEDVKNLRIIYYLLRQQKYSVEGARQYLKENRGKAEMQMQLVESLTKFRSFLLELRANLGA